MTALVGRQVKRTFSRVRGMKAGLSRVKTHEAGGQDLSNFIQSLGDLRIRHEVSICQTILQMLSLGEEH